MTSHLQSKSLVIDSSHFDRGEVKIRIELTSVDTPRRDCTSAVVMAFGCLAVILGVVVGFTHGLARAALCGGAGGLCFVSVGQGLWRRYLRIALMIALPLLALSIGLWMMHRY
ncbi:MAG TPA: hypothetical protein VGA61_07470 [Anaerolineae bacterium]